MDIKTSLKSWNKKTISRSDLERVFQTDSDAVLCSLVSGAVSAGLLSPVRSSGTNGNRVYPVYLKYRITIKEDYSEILSEIAMLHPAIVKSGYLQSRPELYVKYKQQLQRLNAYLFRGRRKVSVSKKECSFDIFDWEKQLEDVSFRSLLDHIGLTAESLGYYETPEYCFNDYIPERRSSMNLLILENKDIWFNIRRRMYEDGARELLGTKIDGAVYGCGNRVSEAGALSAYTRFMGAKTVRYLYWGDIDRAGLNIYRSLLKNNPELEIHLFVPAYEEMLRLSEKRVIPESGDHREQTEQFGEIYGLFSEERKAQLIGLIENNQLLPQEIINYESLLTLMR